MGIYIGYIEEKNEYFNFTPIAEVNDGKIFPLTYEERKEVLPESIRGNICLSYQMSNFSDDNKNKMKERFPNKSLFIFEFELDELEDNLNYRDGERNPTGYKVNTEEVIKSRKLRHLCDENIYQLIDISCFDNEFPDSSVITLKYASLPENEKFLIDYDDKYFIGDYSVGYSSLDSDYYFKPNLKETNYVLYGYEKDKFDIIQLEDLDTQHWSTANNVWNVVVINESHKKVPLDFINDKKLLDVFINSLKSFSYDENSKISLDQLKELINNHNNNFLGDIDIPEDIRLKRIERINGLLINEANINHSLKSVSEVIFDFLCKFKDDENVKAWKDSLLIERPQLIDQFKESKVASARIDDLRKAVYILEGNKQELDKEIEDKRKEIEELNAKKTDISEKIVSQQNFDFEENKKKLEEIQKKLDIGDSCIQLLDKQTELEHQNKYLQNTNDKLKHEAKTIEDKFQAAIFEQHEKMVDMIFDGYVSKKMLEAAATWDTADYEKKNLELVNIVNGIEVAEMDSKSLISYLYEMVHSVRPDYSKNVILNIAICLTQGFLTIFSGIPGCGKTSICNIFAEVLGLNKILELTHNNNVDESIDRFISVSVERGWTSKRDFVGYYNPLSKTFDKSNKKIFNALNQLNLEAKLHYLNLPFMILLDEANLSPMEYYWSDFMNICDDLNEYSTVNLGEDYVFNIPETLHFIGTINNDHTTETLSPRLIDRSWVITLPTSSTNMAVEQSVLEKDKIKVVGWEILKKTFSYEKYKDKDFSNQISQLYNQIISQLDNLHINISKRTDLAIRRYWAVASALFEEDETRIEPSIVALDYAICQKILPKISGSGEDFKIALEGLRNLCSSEGLNLSAKMLKEIIDIGNQRMKYYQFF